MKHSVVIPLLVLGIFANYAWAETIELVTYYPTSSNAGDQHLTSLTVGNAYLNTTLAAGQALIQASLGIGPGFANNEPAAPTMLQVQGVDAQDSTALFLPGAGGTMSVGIGTTPVLGSALDVTGGDLFVRQTAGSGNHVRIRAPSDANTAIELRSETAGGNPYIDFANDAATDFDMRIQLTGNDELRIDGGALQVRREGGVDQTGQLARYTNDAQPTSLSLLKGRNTAAVPFRPSLNDGLGMIRFQGVNVVGQNYDGATIQAIASANWTNASAPADMVFSTTPSGANGSAERMRITDDGRVLIGTTVVPPTAPTTLLVARRDADEMVMMRVENQNNSANAAARVFAVSQQAATPISIGMDAFSQNFNTTTSLGAAVPGNTLIATFATFGAMAANLGNLFIASRGPNQRIAFHTGNLAVDATTERMRITNTGLVGINITNPTFRLQLPNLAVDSTGRGRANAWTTYSSIRWKENITSIDHPLDKIQELRGVYFNWKKEQGGVRDIGLIAEEVGKIIPEVVSYEENGKDASGITYDRLVALLVEGIKELKVENDALKKRIDDLEKKS